MSKGTGLTVEYFVNLPANGTTFEEILHEYEGLSREDILACLPFAARLSESTDFMPPGSETLQVRFLADERPAVKTEVLRKLLSAYSDRIPGQFVVVTETEVRFARIYPALGM